MISNSYNGKKYQEKDVNGQGVPAPAGPTPPASGAEAAARHQASHRGGRSSRPSASDGPAAGGSRGGPRSAPSQSKAESGESGGSRGGPRSAPSHSRTEANEGGGPRGGGGPRSAPSHSRTEANEGGGPRGGGPRSAPSQSKADAVEGGRPARGTEESGQSKGGGKRRGTNRNQRQYRGPDGHQQGSSRGSKPNHDDVTTGDPSDGQPGAPTAENSRGHRGRGNTFNREGRVEKKACGPAMRIDYTRYSSVNVSMIGESRSSPIHDFSEAQLPTQLLKNIQRIGFESPTPVQRYSLPALLAGQDVLLVAQTGAGKTAAFSIPVLSHLLQNKGSRCLVVSPTEETSAQVLFELKRLALNTSIHVRGSGHQDARKPWDVLVSTPPRLTELTGTKKDSKKAEQAAAEEDSPKEHFNFLILDDFERLVERGAILDVRRLLAQCSQEKRTTVISTAAINNALRKVAGELLDGAVELSVDLVPGIVADVTQEFYSVRKQDRDQTLLDLIKRHTCEESTEEGSPVKKSPKIIVFSKTKNRAQTVADFLRKEGLRSGALNPDKNPTFRDQILNSFCQGRLDILVGTSTVTRGLDLPEIDIVINYDLPFHMEDLVYRVGTVGSKVNLSKTISLVDMTEDQSQVEDLKCLLAQTSHTLPDWLTASAEESDSKASQKRQHPTGTNQEGVDKLNPPSYLRQESNSSTSTKDTNTEKPKRKKRKKRKEKRGGDADAKSDERIDESENTPPLEDSVVQDYTITDSKSAESAGEHRSRNPQSAKKKSTRRTEDNVGQQHKSGGGQPRQFGNSDRPAAVASSDGPQRPRGGGDRYRDREPLKRHATTDADRRGPAHNRREEEMRKSKSFTYENRRQMDDYADSEAQLAESVTAAEQVAHSRHSADKEMMLADTKSRMMADDDSNDGVETKNNPGFSSRIREFHDSRGEGTRSLDYTDSEYQDGRRRLSRSTSGPGKPNNPVADIVGILHQQASGTPSFAQSPRREDGSSGYRPQDERMNNRGNPARYEGSRYEGGSGRYDGGGGGGRYDGGAGRYDGGGRFDGGYARYGGHQGVVNKNVADLASLLELKARLANERAEQISARQTSRRNRAEADLSNTSNWPALK